MYACSCQGVKTFSNCRFRVLNVWCMCALIHACLSGPMLHAHRQKISGRLAYEGFSNAVKTNRHLQGKSGFFRCVCVGVVSTCNTEVCAKPSLLFGQEAKTIATSNQFHIQFSSQRNHLNRTDGCKKQQKMSCPSMRTRPTASSCLQTIGATIMSSRSC